MPDLPDHPIDPRLGPRSPREQAELYERERRARRPPDPEEERAAEFVTGFGLAALGALVSGIGLGVAVGPVAGLYAAAFVLGTVPVVFVVHPDSGAQHADLPRGYLVLLGALTGFAVVGGVVHLFSGGLVSLLFALLLGAPLGAGAGWLLGTAVLLLARGLRRLARR